MSTAHGGMFARLECEKASGEITSSTARRKNLSQDVLHLLQEVDAPLTTSQIAKRIGSTNRSLWHALQRLEEDGHIVGTVRYKEALNAREAVWQLAQEV